MQRTIQTLKPILFLALLSASSFTLADTVQEYLNKGDEAFDSYQLSIAERNYLLALRKDPQSIRAHQNLVRVYQAQKRYVDGLAIVDKAIEQNNDNPELWVSRGLLLRDSGNIRKSNQAYMQAVKYANKNAAILRQAEDHFYSVGNQMLAREVGIQRKQIEAGASK